MPTTARIRAAAWVLCYFLLGVAPLALSLVSLDPGRGFWVNLSVAAGFVGLALMGLQFILAARTVQVSSVFGPDIQLRIHRQMTVVIAILIFAHPLILFAWDARFLELLNPVTSPLRAKLAVISVFLLLVLIVTSVWRRRLRLRYSVWQVLHSVLAVAIVVTALLHVLLIGYYVSERWEQALWMAYTVAFVWIAIWVRVVRPILRWRRRWRVIAVSPEGPNAHRLELELVDPKSYGPGGFAFAPGQYAWIHTGSSPFAMTYHPFSFSSSAQRPERLTFTIKQEHGFTTTIGDLTPGHTVYLDGPWGGLSVDRHPGPGNVFIAAGVGVTPMLSMLETLADRGDSRPCWLFLGNRHEDDIIGADQITSLRERMSNLTVVHVISRPGPDWDGLTGHLRTDIFATELPADRGDLHYFLCATEPVMHSCTQALRELSVPANHIHAERFAMA